MYYAHVKRLRSVKWRGLYGDTATMQELLLKTCTRSARRKRSLEWKCHWIAYGTGLQHSLALADLPLRKLWKRMDDFYEGGRWTIASMYSLKKVLPTLDDIRTALKQSIGYTGSKGSLCKNLIHTKSAYTRCGVNQKVLMERQDVVLSRIRFLRMVRELREAGYTDDTYVHTSYAVPKCWQDSTVEL